VVDNAGGVPGRQIAGDQGTDPSAGGGVDRRQLPDRADASGLATEKLSRATRSPGRAAKRQNPNGLLVGGVAVGMTGGRRPLASSVASPERWPRPARRSWVVPEMPRVRQASVRLVWPARSRTWTRRW
jgi:hypothetical protein